MTSANLDEWIFAYDATMQLNYDWYKQATPGFFLFPWGGDFLYYNASKEFSNMDRLLAAVGNSDRAKGHALSVKRINARRASNFKSNPLAVSDKSARVTTAPSYSTVPAFFDALAKVSANLTSRSGE